jgi:hypothetical protein
MTIHPTDSRQFNATDEGLVENGLHPLRKLGPKYPPHNANAPIMEGIDVAGLVAAVIITLGPLAAYSFGMGA